MLRDCLDKESTEATWRDACSEYCFISDLGGEVVSDGCSCRFLVIWCCHLVNVLVKPENLFDKLMRSERENRSILGENGESCGVVYPAPAGRCKQMSKVYNKPFILPLREVTPLDY